VGTPQDWAPYSSVEVYLRDPDLALDQLRSVIDLSAIKSFIMSRGQTDESSGEAVWQCWPRDSGSADQGGRRCHGGNGNR
jgi:hypothetical protein